MKAKNISPIAIWLKLHPKQWIIFSSSDDSAGVGTLIPIQVKDIISWEGKNMGDGDWDYEVNCKR